MLGDQENLHQLRHEDGEEGARVAACPEATEAAQRQHRRRYEERREKERPREEELDDRVRITSGIDHDRPAAAIGAAADREIGKPSGGLRRPADRRQQEDREGQRRRRHEERRARATPR